MGSVESPARKQGPMRFLLRLFDAALFLTVIGFGGFTLTLLLARLHWVLDNATGFEFVFFLVSLPLVIVAAIRRMRITGAIAGVLAIYHAMLVAPFYIGSPPDAIKRLKGFRVMSANLQWDSKDPERVYKIINQEAPDILALQEVTPSRLPELERLRDNYPYWTHYAEASVLGVALLSKFPITEEKRRWITKGVYPTVIATLDINGTPLHIAITHTVPPFSSDWVKERDAQLTTLQKELIGIPGNRLVVGDLNATMWTPSYRDFVHAAGLQNARKGHGVVPTYKFRGIPMVPIDHILTRGNVVVQDCRAGPEMGSDHRPLIVDIAYFDDVREPTHISDN
ncbi:MAG: endonuclease/exonuclease/phosphatase family protein [Candidatus Hydrogenedentes bacterium]|nr:endonuclease/exonuclease/phosphatase family protein [Candidatus Hydrogenedentota bacterium]